MASTLVNLQIHHSGNFVSDPDLSEPILVEDITELDPTIQTEGHDSGLNEEIEESDEGESNNFSSYHLQTSESESDEDLDDSEGSDSLFDIDENIEECSEISPMAMEILGENAQRAAKCEVKFNGETGYEIQDGPYKHVVDFRAYTCTCRSWQLKGIPCAHAITAMHYKNYEVEPYVDHWYRKDTYLKAYSRFIQPLTSMNLWPTSTLPAMEPPVITAMPGRPKKKRTKAADEPKKKFGKGTRIGRQMRCSLCKTLGHNKKGCPSAVSINVCFVTNIERIQLLVIVLLCVCRKTKREGLELCSVPAGRGETAESGTAAAGSASTIPASASTTPAILDPSTQQSTNVARGPKRKTNEPRRGGANARSKRTKTAGYGSTHLKKPQPSPISYLRQHRNLLPGLVGVRDILRSAATPQ
ncbi:hypothetical protein A4A49_64504 [Nicotiana attenuata]|uniref:SWIM-type domain-containing protein n=1 Tax=Nicotiana attenuata TaxID=49451 RepID=A0A314LCS8_NICAT|nr:hypothetical protein A4A49_64504 [Nicotiana attenuata]